MKRVVLLGIVCLFCISTIFAFETITLTFSKPTKDKGTITFTFRWKNPEGVTDQFTVSVPVDTDFDEDEKAAEVEGQIEEELKKQIKRPFKASVKDNTITLEPNEGFTLKKPANADNTGEEQGDLEGPKSAEYSLELFELRGNPCGGQQNGDPAIVRFGPKDRVIEVDTAGKTRQQIIDTLAAGFSFLNIPVVFKNDARIIIFVRWQNTQHMSYGCSDFTMSRYSDGVDLSDWPDSEVQARIRELVFN